MEYIDAGPWAGFGDTRVLPPLAVMQAIGVRGGGWQWHLEQCESEEGVHQTHIFAALVESGV